jgi:hypothetical protein
MPNSLLLLSLVLISATCATAISRVKSCSMQRTPPRTIQGSRPSVQALGLLAAWRQPDGLSDLLLGSGYQLQLFQVCQVLRSTASALVGDQIL